MKTGEGKNESKVVVKIYLEIRKMYIQVEIRGRRQEFKIVTKITLKIEEKERETKAEAKIALEIRKRKNRC